MVKKKNYNNEFYFVGVTGRWGDFAALFFSNFILNFAQIYVVLNIINY